MGHPYEDVHFFRQDKRLQLPNVPFAVGLSHRHPHSIRRDAVGCTSIEYLISGRIHAVINNRSYDIAPGDMFILPRNGRYECSSPVPMRTRKIYLYYHHMEIEHLLALHGLAQVHHVPSCTAAAPWCRALFTLARRFEHTPSEQDALLAEASTYMHRIMILLSQESRKRFIVPGDILAMMNYIDMHLHEPITLSDIAAASGKSVPHAIRVFKRETGSTPHEHLLKRRIETAIFLLKSTGENIRFIASRAGFRNEHYFSAVFKKHTGRPPSVMRRGFEPSCQ
ncbi:MAG: AraC family transcriptional regulator [Spirochaetota bacterium]